MAAVDAHVASHLFNHCFMGLLQRKTRILCTHHTKFLQQADLVVGEKVQCTCMYMYMYQLTVTVDFHACMHVQNYNIFSFLLHVNTQSALYIGISSTASTHSGYFDYVYF